MKNGYRMSPERALKIGALVVCLTMSSRSHAAQMTLAQLLERAGAASAVYADEATAVIGEERCDQASHVDKTLQADAKPTVTGNELRFAGVPSSSTASAGQAKWVAELAIIRTPKAAQYGFPWLEFRDILQVEGKPSREGLSRLEALFRQAPDVALVSARAIDADAARIGVNPKARQIPIPRMACLFLHPLNQSRFVFELEGEKRLGAITTYEVRFTERPERALLRDLRGGTLSSGTFWIEPTEGRVVMSLMRTSESKGCYTEILMTYGLDPATSLWLPTTMKETAVDGNEGLRTEGTATYGKWRRVQDVKW